MSLPTVNAIIDPMALAGDLVMTNVSGTDIAFGVVTQSDGEIVAAGFGYDTTCFLSNIAIT